MPATGRAGSPPADSCWRMPSYPTADSLTSPAVSTLPSARARMACWLPISWPAPWLANAWAVAVLSNASDRLAASSAAGSANAGVGPYSPLVCSFRTNRHCTAAICCSSEWLRAKSSRAFRNSAVRPRSCPPASSRICRATASPTTSHTSRRSSPMPPSASSRSNAGRMPRGSSTAASRGSSLVDSLTSRSAWPRSAVPSAVPSPAATARAWMLFSVNTSWDTGMPCWVSNRRREAKKFWSSPASLAAGSGTCILVTTTHTRFRSPAAAPPNLARRATASSSIWPGNGSSARVNSSAPSSSFR